MSITLLDIADAFKASPNEALQALGQETIDRLASAGEYERPVQFITTSHTPHRWSSGETVSSFDLRTFRDYRSLDEARADAQSKAAGGHNEDHTDTAFGIRWTVPN